MSLADQKAVSDVARLAAIQEISALKARYFRFMDTKQWADWEGVFAPGVLMDMVGEAAGLKSLGFSLPDDVSMTWRGREQLRSAVGGALEGVRTVHHGHMPELEILSETEARGIWAMEDLLVYSPEAGAPVPGFRGYGHYHDTYVKLDGRWYIQSTRLERLFLLPLAR